MPMLWLSGARERLYLAFDTQLIAFVDTNDAVCGIVRHTYGMSSNHAVYSRYRRHFGGIL